MIRSSLHCIKSPNRISLIIKFKNHNLIAVQNQTQVRIRIIYDSILQRCANSARGCIQMAITIGLVIENVRMSRGWKAELVAYAICWSYF
jgi:hypothetical protein